MKRQRDETDEVNSANFKAPTLAVPRPAHLAIPSFLPIYLMSSIT